MRTTMLTLAAACLVLATPLPGQETDEARVRAVLEDYVTGWRDADVPRLARAFATDQGRILWLSGPANHDTLKSMTFAEALQNRRPQPEYGREWRVLALDIVDGKLAVAKLHISRRGGSYVDYLVLQNISGEWRIVAKTFVMR